MVSYTVYTAVTRPFVFLCSCLGGVDNVKYLNEVNLFDAVDPHVSILGDAPFPATRSHCVPGSFYLKKHTSDNEYCWMNYCHSLQHFN